MERAAAGESFLITRRGKPYARLSPAFEQLPVVAGSTVDGVEAPAPESEATEANAA